MSAENMAELQKYEKKMSAAQRNANLAQQMGLANLTNEQQASMFIHTLDVNMDMNACTLFSESEKSRHSLKISTFTFKIKKNALTCCLHGHKPI